MSPNSIQILPNLSKSMPVAWFQSELVPVVLHNSKRTQVILSPSTVELVNWAAASLSWDDWVLEWVDSLHYSDQSGCCEEKKGLRAAGSVLAIDIASMAATLPYCNVRDSFDHSIILL